MYEDYKRVYINGIKTEYFVSKDGDVISKYKNRIHRMKVFETDKGYQYVKLWINNNVCPEGTVKCEDRPDRKGEKIEKIRKKYKCIFCSIYGCTRSCLFLQRSR